MMFSGKKVSARFTEQCEIRASEKEGQLKENIDEEDKEIESSKIKKENISIESEASSDLCGVDQDKKLFACQ